jgi:type III restriction enzyme
VPLGPGFPIDPYEVIDPSQRWYPGFEELELEDAGKLIPPLVAEIRVGVHEWRLGGYRGVSKTSRDLLSHWFKTPHLISKSDGSMLDFRYYFAQREAVETAIWLFEYEKARDPFSLMRYDSTELVSKMMFPEDWTRYVFKLATGAGKTKVLSLLIAWAYFHRKYEPDSTLSTNFLLVAPNIIVLDRLLDDFGNLRIFTSDPVIPENGFEGRNWKSDFQITLHVQDEIGVVSPTGNLFLTNIHRVYEAAPGPTSDDEDLTDFFLGRKPVAKTTQSVFELAEVVRSIDDLVVLNDEAHHIHDENLAWFRAIQGIDARMKQRTGHGIAAQFDTTATPKDQNGAVFAQTVCSYPLVEAIRQRVVKTPVVPDAPSRAKLVERPSDQVAERYADHIKLGYLEWAKRKEELEKCGKKPVLFIMTTTTSESDEVAAYVERKFPDLRGKVLTIHTKANGELSGKPGDRELEVLRVASRTIDSNESPYQCVVSVLMLREGWDVQNVISMVGLRPYTAKSGVLPEQTLGRGLRRMFREDPEMTEYVSVVGTPAFLEFVESVRAEGVELEQAPMGNRTTPKKPLLIEVDHLDPEKDINDLDISIPRLSSRVERQMKNLHELDVNSIAAGDFEVRLFTTDEQREIVFLDLDTDQPAWSTDLGEEIVPTQQSVLSFLTRELMHRMRLVGGHPELYEKLRDYISQKLFSESVNLDDPNILRNISELGPRRHLFESFAEAINRLTLVDSGTSTVISQIKLSKTRPAVVSNQAFMVSKKTIFNRVIGDSNLELRFAQYLDKLPDVRAFAKNTKAVHFFMEYVNATGEISHYYPDFIVKATTGEIFIVETKGLQDLDVLPKWRRLVQWCVDATSTSEMGTRFTPIFLSEEDFGEIESRITTMRELVEVTRNRTPLGAKP